MGFKSDKIRRMLFAQDKDKAQGMPSNQSIPSNKSSPASFATQNHPEIIKPVQPINSGVPQFKPPMQKSIKPTSNPGIIPSLPALPKMAKFAKVKKYLKKV